MKRFIYFGCHYYTIMTKLTLFLIILLLFASPVIALQISNEALNFSILRGENLTMSYVISNDENRSISVTSNVRGEASKFITWNEVKIIQPYENKSIDVLVSIPQNYIGNETLINEIYTTTEEYVKANRSARIISNKTKKEQISQRARKSIRINIISPVITPKPTPISISELIEIPKSVGFSSLLMIFVLFGTITIIKRNN